MTSVHGLKYLCNGRSWNIGIILLGYMRVGPKHIFKRLRYLALGIEIMDLMVIYATWA